MSPGHCPQQYARHLLDSLGLAEVSLPADDQRPAQQLWALSGAMWLSGQPDAEPVACPAPLASCAQGAWLALCSLYADVLDPGFDAFALLGERAAVAGLKRRGRHSAGGACRLFDVADGVIALNLARDADRELLPAWLQVNDVSEDALPGLLAGYPLAGLVERARLLGLAAAAVEPPQPGRDWCRAQPLAEPAPPPVSAPLVIDLSALWAGPLCAQLLQQAGARVIKVESVTRPDGARSGPETFYHLMNTGKESVAVDLATDRGRAQLQRLLDRADIVIEASRPRALEQLGIDATALVRQRPGKVWLSITGYGRQAPMREWIAYGDDAGIAAGLGWLMGGSDGEPVFAGDAIADPLTGLHAALAAAAHWRRGGGVLLDLPLVGVVGHCIDSGAGAQPGDAVYPAAPPRARSLNGHAAALGADNDRVLRELMAEAG